MRPEQIDETAVNIFAIAMKDKLRIVRERGKGGWYDSQDCTIEDLVDFFNLQTVKPERDYVDIGIFAMMIWNRKMK